MVVSGVEASPVLEPAEHGLNSAALFVEDGVVGIGAVRLDFEGMQAAILRFASASRNQSAS